MAPTPIFTVEATLKSLGEKNRYPITEQVEGIHGIMGSYIHTGLDLKFSGSCALTANLANKPPSPENTRIP